MTIWTRFDIVSKSSQIVLTSNLFETSSRSQNSTRFESFREVNDIITYIINVKTFVIYVRNVIDKLMIILKYIKLYKIIDFDEKNYYYIDYIIVYLTIDVNWKRCVIIVIIDFVVVITLILIKVNFVEFAQNVSSI